MVVVSHLFLSLRKSFRGRFDSCESNLPLFGTIYFPTAPSTKFIIFYCLFVCLFLIISKEFISIIPIQKFCQFRPFICSSYICFITEHPFSFHAEKKLHTNYLVQNPLPDLPESLPTYL